MAEEKVFGWPERWPVAQWIAVGVALLFFGLEMTVECARQWSFAERHYLPAYLWAQTVGRIYPVPQHYRLLTMVDRNGVAHFAKADEIEATTLANGRHDYRLTQEGVRAGGVRVGWQEGVFDNARLRKALKHDVYLDLRSYVEYPAIGALIILGMGLCFAIPLDSKRARKLKMGRIVEGPLLVCASEFNRSHAADGIGFVNHNRTMMEKLLGTGKTVCIPRDEENAHVLFVGDTGMGKSALIRQILNEIEQRGEAAIILDAKPDYVTDYYRPERGDCILNPFDARMPYWNPGDEVRNPAEALALATAAVKEDPKDIPFFIQTAREVLAEMLMKRPTAQELTHWLCNPDEIGKLMKDTAYKSSIHQEAPGQKQGVLGSLALVYNSFRFLPTKEETKRSWNSVEWSRDRNGWLFITSRSEYKEILRPIDSLWLDMLVLRLMSDRRPGARRTWFILDEVATLNKLPQLHAALTLGRDAGISVALGLQGRSQLDGSYREDAETMVSQPSTKVFLRTGYPASEWVSKSLGWVRKEYLRESYTNSGEKTTYTHGLEIRTPEALVLDGDISGLPKFVGYLRREDKVVRLSFGDKNYKKPVPRHPGLIERKLPSAKASTAAAGDAAKPFFE